MSDQPKHEVTIIEKPTNAMDGRDSGGKFVKGHPGSVGSGIMQSSLKRSLRSLRERWLRDGVDFIREIEALKNKSGIDDQLKFTILKFLAGLQVQHPDQEPLDPIEPPKQVENLSNKPTTQLINEVRLQKKPFNERKQNE